MPVFVIINLHKGKETQNKAMIQLVDCKKDAKMCVVSSMSHTE